MLPVAPIELAELLLGASQADLETFDLAEPAFRLGFGDSGDQVVADLGKPCPLGRVRSEERASDASFSELARSQRLTWLRMARRERPRRRGPRMRAVMSR
ncbi:hypothetical protein GCM10023196_022750 [Actinoallomurus vinaceus]|uniref:Uncharacterized protein n=1 Tax=Actinoallomurus vinaceus TaxID=1080074 RepID=A0ABP8U503_9ACTN